jgi:hypothetical protein
LLRNTWIFYQTNIPLPMWQETVLSRQRGRPHLRQRKSRLRLQVLSEANE